MDTRQLSVFLTVARSLNFTRASEEHYMTQPAITHQISTLERELEAKLFVRSSHHVELTAAGKEFLAYAESIMTTTRLAQARLYNITHGKTGQIKVMAVQTATHVAVKCLSEFSKRYPGIQVDADIVTGADQINAITENSADIYITVSPLLRAYHQLDYRVLQKEQFALIYRKDVLKEVDIHDFSNLATVPLICELKAQAPYIVNQIFKICGNRGLFSQNVHWCKDAISLLLALKSGLGFGLTSTCDITSGFTEGLEVVALEGTDTLTDCSIGWKRDTSNEATKYFLEVVAELYPETN